MKQMNTAIQNQNQSGNAMVYVLIALALFGFLTVTMSRQNQQADGRNLNKENVNLYVEQLIEYSAAAGQAIDMMLISGSEIGNLDFTKPGGAGFDTPPHFHKLFHPQGGGLNYVEKPSEAIQNDATSVWDFNNIINVEWTPSSADDVILTAYFINEQICAALNKKITGSATIPVTASPHEAYFLSAGNTDFNTTECAACDGLPLLCVENDTNDNYSFYSVLAGR